MSRKDIPSEILFHPAEVMRYESCVSLLTPEAKLDRLCCREPIASPAAHPSSLETSIMSAQPLCVLRERKSPQMGLWDVAQALF
jgi:hypothetical protein